MANSRKQPPDKIGADCPNCGFSQLEPVSAKSTFCRQCGQHYSIERLLAKEIASLKEPSFFDKISKLISRETTREVTCFSCRGTHEVSSSAQSSLCPQCGSYIDIRDFRIAGPFARSVQTQGLLHLSPTADVASHRMLCGKARIEGRFRGRIVCTGEASVQLAGPYEGEIDAGLLVIHKKANVEFQQPVYARKIEVNGKTRGTVVCDGQVVINKKGALDGTIYARSIVIEKGGYFSGSLIIGEEPPVELRRVDERTWFPGGSNTTPALVSGDFGDLPPSIGGSSAVEYEEEPLHQPQLELQPRRPRRRGR
ncbi:MAG: polymer-forming cytoskeletal protein [Verrucomicrobiota bacterium]